MPTFKINVLWSLQARDRKVAGDLEGARHYGSTARCLNIWATILIFITVISSIITLIVFAILSKDRIYSGYNPNKYNFGYGRKISNCVEFPAAVAYGDAFSARGTICNILCDPQEKRYRFLLCYKVSNGAHPCFLNDKL